MASRPGLKSSMINPEQDLPKLPVARVLWDPKPNMEIAAQSWILAGGAHHTVAVIDDFHDAAAQGDRDRYLGHFTEHAVFMGTDEWERWPKHPEFTDYVSSRFKDGSGWNYRSVERTIRIANSPDVARSDGGPEQSTWSISATSD